MFKALLACSEAALDLQLVASEASITPWLGITKSMQPSRLICRLLEQSFNASLNFAAV